MMLQERINEMDSGILTIEGDRVHVMGFRNEKMLMSFLHNGKKNWSSIGLYGSQELDFSSIKNDALFIVMRDGKEIAKYQYVPLHKETINYVNEEGKKASMTFTIRRGVYSDHYHFFSEKISRTFESKESIINYVKEEFGTIIDFSIMGDETMKNMILVDIETGGFDVDLGILEVALLVVENGEIVHEEHLAEVEDPSSIHLGMGAGYADISEVQTKKEIFKEILAKYNYPIVAHNVPFDRKFLVYYGWLDEDYECFDSIRAIKYANPNLFSYSLHYLASFYELELPVSHIALDDVKTLFEVIKRSAPTTWLPLFKVKPKQLDHIVETIAKIEGESTIFQGKTIVFTGTSPFPRVLMTEIALKCGAKVTGSVSPNTNYLICGEKPGSKLEKAKELDIEVLTDMWFLDAVSKELNLDSVTIEKNRVPIQSSFSEGPYSTSYKRLQEFKGKIVNIACLPARVQSQVEEILSYMEVGGLSKGSNGYKVDLIIYSDNGDYMLLEKAKSMNIQTIPLSKFNKMIL
ncbi:BRCT domain-containing protein [Neobacillus sp. PS2-9]|uniref:3'-5' exonuclease n=1 Tax=Neobacillus sp. PS2-9 TaxID=3070676 RepID=UPI0027DEAC9D|nr:BRCT domain-containing protein [Neobacillus sp. PS2-9]WML56504.1 BRCT domain-containing protein [Neobacillus sp. PS2-9]